MNTGRLSLLTPRAIAVIGATEKPGRPGANIFERLHRAGHRTYPVHPTEKTVLGQPVLATPEELPDDVDLAVIAIGAEGAVAVAERCARRGIPNLIVVAGGFAETGEKGRLLEARLRDIHAGYGTRLLGPNTLGIFLPHQQLDTIFVEHAGEEAFEPGGVAFVTQSGSVGVEALWQASGLGFGLRAFVGLGNKCDLDELDFLCHFAQDEGTTCLAFYVESLERARAFLEKARDVARRKPVVMLKAGRTSAGASAVSSHTGRLAGSDRVVDGALRQFGVQRAADDEALCDAARILSMLPAAPGNRVAIVTAAGGYGVIGADYVESSSRVVLRMAALATATEERIRAASFPFASCHNPVDLTAGVDDKMFGAALDALLDDEGVDIVICNAFFAPAGISDGLIDEIASRAAENRKPIVVFTQYGPRTSEYTRRFFRAGVVAFPSACRTVRAVRFLVERRMIVDALGTGE